MSKTIGSWLIVLFEWDLLFFPPRLCSIGPILPDFLLISQEGRDSIASRGVF